MIFRRLETSYLLTFSRCLALLLSIGWLFGPPGQFCVIAKTAGIVELNMGQWNERSQESIANFLTANNGNPFTFGSAVLPGVTFVDLRHYSTLSQKVPITVYATDPIGVSNIEIYVNNTLLAALPIRPSLPEAQFTFDWDTTNTADGKHMMRTIAYNDEGGFHTAMVVVRVLNFPGETPPAPTTTPTPTSTPTLTPTASPTATPMVPGSLFASRTLAPPTVNLSDEGTADWAHWGLASPSSFNHKVGVAPQISNYAVLGSGTILQLDDSSTFYSWIGGTPTASANTATGVYVIGLTNGFRITAPADTTARTLKLYVSLWAAGGRFEASLSDGSAPAYIDTSLVNSTASSNAVYTVNYRAASPVNSLTISWVVNSMFDTWGNVAIEGSSLAVDGPPSPTPTATPTAPRLQRLQ